MLHSGRTGWSDSRATVGDESQSQDLAGGVILHFGDEFATSERSAFHGGVHERGAHEHDYFQVGVHALHEQLDCRHGVCRNHDGDQADDSAAASSSTENMPGIHILVAGDYQSMVAAMGECWECKFSSKINEMQRQSRWPMWPSGSSQAYLFFCVKTSVIALIRGKANSTTARSEARGYDSIQSW